MSLVEKILKRFGYTKSEGELPFPLADVNIDLEEDLPDALWGVEGLGGLSSTRRPVDPRGHPAEGEDQQ